MAILPPQQKHVPSYRKNFADNTTNVNCSCGWYGTAERYEEPDAVFRQHMTDVTKISDLPPPIDMSPEVADMSLARFRKAEHPQGIDPITALDAAKAWCLAQAPDGRPQHIIVSTIRRQSQIRTLD